MAQGNGDLTTA